jgi:hypothetical protein
VTLPAAVIGLIDPQRSGCARQLQEVVARNRALTESGRPVDDERHGGVLDEAGQDGHRMEDLMEPEPLR